MNLIIKAKTIKVFKEFCGVFNHGSRQNLEEMGGSFLGVVLKKWKCFSRQIIGAEFRTKGGLVD